MNTSFDKDKVGTYNVEYTVKDSDGNESSYIITIEVKEKNQSNDSSMMIITKTTTMMISLMIMILTKKE